MQKLLFLLLAATALLFATSCAKKTTAGVGDDGVDWAARARQYRDDPAALRAFTEECEANEARLIATQQELTNYRNQANANSQAMQGNQAQMASTQQQVQLLTQENAQLRQQLEMMANTRNDQVDTDRQVVQGVVFQVQLGAYAQNRVDPNLATEDALELQDQNGLQKVVVSQFRTYANAAQLRDRLKQMGVRDAFIVAKNNGQRIAVDEALRMTGQN